jgi:hypothetical protein
MSQIEFATTPRKAIARRYEFYKYTGPQGVLPCCINMKQRPTLGITPQWQSRRCFAARCAAKVYGQARDGVRAYERYLAMLNRGM